ncbi:addiction module antidote protein [Acidisoma cladoniae]|jgi:probable addiction module antidote protein|uniref:addiction module antidote protein n=1 Tax=Acidisoma cladoniae TaxID=3040935 RepID=UPI00254E4635|nr:addiction module antidote protein [Acidisoma sp. PAMC 29798]
MTVETKAFDVADVLNSEDRIAAYLEEAFEDGDPVLISTALGAVARARSIGVVAKQTGLTRETLYRALSPDGNPTLSTLTAVTKALGFHLSIRPLRPSERT